MPIAIPMADQRRPLGDVAVTQVPDTGASSIAEAISRLGKQGQEVAQHMLQQRTQMQSAAYVSDALATYQKDYLNKTQDMEMRYAETNGAGYHNELIEWDKKKRDELRKQANVPEAQAEFDQSVSKASTSALLNADATEQKYFTTYHTKQLTEYTKDVTNSIPLIKDKLIQKVESLSLTYADKLKNAQTMGLLNATQIKEQENSGMSQIAVAGALNASEQGDVATVAMFIGGGERFFTPKVLKWMDQYYPATDPKNAGMRAYITNKITTSGIKNKASFLEKYLTAEQKEKFIGIAMSNLAVQQQQEHDDLELQRKEINARLSQTGIPDDAPTVQHVGLITQRYKDKVDISDFEKENAILSMPLSMTGGQMRKAFKQVPQYDGARLINQFKALDFSNPEKQKEAEAFMTAMGFTPEIKAILIANPHLGATKMKELGNVLEREHRSYWTDMKRDSGTKLYDTNENVHKGWDTVLQTFDLSKDTPDLILDQQAFKKAILVAKSMENQLGIPNSDQTTIPLDVAKKIVGQMDAVFKAGDSSKIDVALDALRGAMSYGDAYPGLFDNVETRLVEADKGDFFTTGTLFVMNLPPGPERVQLIENMTPKGKSTIEGLLANSGFDKDAFMKKFETSGIFRGLESSLSTDLYGTNKVLKLKDALTDELIRRSLTDRNYINRKEKAGSIDDIVSPDKLRSVVNDYINKTHTVYQTAGADMVISNEVLNRNIEAWPAEFKALATRPQFKEGLMLASELTARDTALYDANFVVPQQFITQAKAAAAAGRATVFGLTLPKWLDAAPMLDNPTAVKKFYLNSLVLRPNGSDGLKFTLGNIPVLKADGTPYTIKWDNLLNSGITKDYVLKGTMPKDYNVYTLFGLYGQKGTEKQAEKIKKEVGENIEKQEKLRNKQAQEELDKVEEERKSNLGI